MKRIPVFPSLLLALICNFSLARAAQVTVAPSGSSSFTIQGSGMDGVSGMELNIRYDSVSLQGTPIVKQESLVSGAMFAANTAVPGSISVAIVSSRGFSGNGPIATITFLSKSASAPLPSLTTTMIDSNGAAMASTVGTFVPHTLNPPDSGNQTGQTTVSAGQNGSLPSQGANQVSSSSTTTSLGMVTLPTEQQQRNEPQRPAPVTPAPHPLVENQDEPATTKAPEQTQPVAKPTPDTKVEETPQYIVYKGVLDRFKMFSGVKSLAAVTALFDRRITGAIRQTPDPAVGNEKKPVSVAVDIPVKPGTSPNFALDGGTLVSFKQDKQVKGRWNVEIIPEAGAVRTILTVITDAEEFAYPLTVAPLVKTSLTFDETGWNKFIREVGSDEAPLHDFNNDGVRDYVDEFIFVANYRLRKAEPASHSPAVKGQK